LEDVAPLRTEGEILLDAIKRDGMMLKHIDRSVINHEVVLEAVKQNGLALQFAPVDFRADPEIVSAALKQNSEAVAFAMESIEHADGTKSFVVCPRDKPVLAPQCKAAAVARSRAKTANARAFAARSFYPREGDVAAVEEVAEVEEEPSAEVEEEPESVKEDCWGPWTPSGIRK
jgi:hypothetical protein